MSTKNKTVAERLSFYELFAKKGLKIEIPIIQRDYAQGRPQQKIIRKNFLHSLKNYLESDEQHDLDFVYGTIENNHFIPLDGQQRLTTLFLLHWYLAQKEAKQCDFKSQFTVLVDNKYRSTFTYRTRSSSKEFCDALVQHEVSSDDMYGRVLSEIIKDSSWFFSSWQQDPTISSMLTMLDAMHETFADTSDLYERLVGCNPAITFMFLNLDNFKLTDDLYIKMNARGRPLTHFENFKSQLLKKIENKDNVLYKSFSLKIDTKWSDIFWAISNLFSESKESIKKVSYDDCLMNYIRLILEQYTTITNNKNIIFYKEGKPVEFSIDEYDELGVFENIGVFTHLSNFLNLLKLDNGKLKSKCLLSYDSNYYNESDIFQGIVENNATYASRLKFFAFYQALNINLSANKINEWLRVIYNLVENTIFDTSADYTRALSSINTLLTELSNNKALNHSILQLLKNKKTLSISGFLSSQVKEEIIKAHLLVNSNEWATAITRYEKHLYFKGQIGFILRFSGVVDHFISNEPSFISNYRIDELLESFNHYALKASQVFDFRLDENYGVKKNYVWERAVLSKGDYFTDNGGHYPIFNFLSGSDVFNRDHSWKRLLRLSENPNRIEQQGFVKAVFDDEMFEINDNDLEKSLEKIARLKSKELSNSNWRKLLLDNPEFFKKSTYGFFDKVPSYKSIILLSTTRRSGYQCDIYISYLSKWLPKVLLGSTFDLEWARSSSEISSSA